MPPRTFLADLLQENTVPVTNQKTKTILVRIRLYKFEGTVQYGCSTRVFLETAKWLNYKIVLNSWDVLDSVKCVDKKDFKLHIEDITNR